LLSRAHQKFARTLAYLLNSPRPFHKPGPQKTAVTITTHSEVFRSLLLFGDIMDSSSGKLQELSLQ
jgi:hypothetical protein